MQDFNYINRACGLAIGRGTRLEYTGDATKGRRSGRVHSETGAHINIQFDDDPGNIRGPFHPTWELKYL